MVGIIDTVKWTDEVKPQSSVNIFLHHVSCPSLCFMVLILSHLCCLPSIFCWCYICNSRAAHVRKETDVANEGLFRNSDK